MRHQEWELDLIAVFPAALYNGTIYSAGAIYWPEPTNQSYKSVFKPNPRMSGAFSRVMAFHDTTMGIIAYGPLHKKSRFKRNIFLELDNDSHVWYVKHHKGKVHYPHEIWHGILKDARTPMWKIEKKVKMTKMRKELVDKAWDIFKIWISGEHPKGD